MGDFDASRPLRLSAQVALRDEAFGALAYHYGTRRLVFLKSPELVALVRSLEAFCSPAEAVASLVAPRQHGAYLAAVERLFDQGVLDAA